MPLQRKRESPIKRKNRGSEKPGIKEATLGWRAGQGLKWRRRIREA